MEQPLDICCAILAGGRSTRMGRDKAMELVQREPMLHRAVRLANQTCLRTMVVGRAVPEDWPADLSATFIEDFEPGHGGPIVGIRSALAAAGEDLLVIACDMPLLSAPILRGLYRFHVDQPEKSWATIAAMTGVDGKLRAEPMLAIYTPAIVSTLEEWIRRGKRSLQQCAGLSRARMWMVPDDLSRQLMNVNDAKELAEARDALEERPETL